MPTTSCRGYQQGSNVQLVDVFTVFSVDADAGRVEEIAAASEEEAVALVRAKYPDAIARAVPADLVEGCNRTLVLWEWMGILERDKQ